MMEISWNYMMEISWKLYAGKFLETICWEIGVDTSGFLMSVIMAQCYSSIEHGGKRPFSIRWLYRPSK